MKNMVYVLAACVVFAGAAFADGSAFTPLNFNDTTFSNTTTISSQDLSTATEEAIGNGNIQNAIGQLENAQVDMRNELLNVKTKFADVDAQYKLIKAERTALKKQVNAVQKRIKELDRAKEKIRKNML